MSSLFISYARADDEPFVKRLHQDLSERGFHVWWDRVAMESRGRTFLQEIRDAIATADRMIAVIGPNAVQSRYVRVEWEHASAYATVVVPILRAGDYAMVPAEFKGHCPDFRPTREYGEALEELSRILKEPVTALGPFRTAVPALPAHFLPRRGELERLSETLLADVQRPVALTFAKQTTAVHGMGGVGKSVLAAAFARSIDARRAFVDGIVWLMVGQNSDPLQNLRLVGLAFDDDPDHYRNLVGAVARLPVLLDDKVCLLILDDVWNVADAAAFLNALGPRCRLLVTTRDGSVASALGTQEHKLGALSDEGALALLADWSEQPVEELPSQARGIAAECGNLPFALALSGAMVRDGTSWLDLLAAFGEADLAFFEKQFPNYPFPNLLKSLKISVDAIVCADPQAAEHYRSLVVFPAAAAVPEAAVVTLWLHTKGQHLTERNARKLLTELGRKALLRIEGEAPQRAVFLHDLQHDYLRATQVDLTALHASMLAAYEKKCADGWPTGPNDGYFFQHLARHLVEAHRRDELKALLMDFNWLRSKMQAAGPYQLVADYGYVAEDTPLRLVEGALRLAAHLLLKESAYLAPQLLGRLSSVDAPQIQALLMQAAKSRTGPWLQPGTACLKTPQEALTCTLEGHRSIVQAVALTPDARVGVSAAGDRTLKIWSLAEGTEARTLATGELDISAIGISPDSSRVVAGTKTGELHIWDVRNSSKLRVIKVHNDEIEALVISEDGRRIVSAAKDGKLKESDLAGKSKPKTLIEYGDVAILALARFAGALRAVSWGDDQTMCAWEMASTTRLRALSYHDDTVTAAALTPDLNVMLTATFETALRVWTVERDREPILLDGHTDWISAVAVTPDGHWALTGSSDHDATVRLWDLTKCAISQSEKAHNDRVVGLAITPDDRLAVSASYDRTLKVWNVADCALVRTLQGHTGSIYALAMTPDGSKIVSAAHDHTLRVWDVDTGACLQSIAVEENHLSALTLTPDGQTLIAASTQTTYKGERENFFQLVTSGKVDLEKLGEQSETVTSLKRWNIDTGALLQSAPAPGGGITALQFSPSGRYFLTILNGILTVADLQENTEYPPIGSAEARVRAVALDAQERVAVVVTGSGTIKVWDFEHRAELRTLSDDTNRVAAIGVTPDGRWGVSLSDQIVKLWNIETGISVAAFRADFPLQSCAFTQDGRKIVAGDSSGRIHFLTLTENAVE